MNFTVSFDLDQKVSSTLSLLLIALLSVLVAIFSLHAAQDIVKLGEDMPVFHIEKRSYGAEVLDFDKSQMENSEVAIP